MSVGSARGAGERIFGGAIGLVFATQFVLALGYPPEPKLFPLIVAFGGMLLCAALLFGFGLHDREVGAPEHIPRPLLALTLSVSPLYGLALYIFGYWIATLVAIPTVAWLLGYRNKQTLALVTVALAIVLGVMFPLLGVGLPAGLLAHAVGF